MFITALIDPTTAIIMGIPMRLRSYIFSLYGGGSLFPDIRILRINFLSTALYFKYYIGLEVTPFKCLA